MDRWVWYAMLSMVFPGCTSVIAKKGLVGMSGELGLAVRTSGRGIAFPPIHNTKSALKQTSKLANGIVTAIPGEL